MAVKDIPLRLNRISQITGVIIDAKDVIEILQSIGMTVGKAGKDNYLITPPTFRASDRSVKASSNPGPASTTSAGIVHTLFLSSVVNGAPAKRCGVPCANAAAL